MISIPENFLDWLARGLDRCPQGEPLIVHRFVPDFHDDHVDKLTCWCQPVTVDPDQTVDGTAAYLAIMAPRAHTPEKNRRDQ